MLSTFTITNIYVAAAKSLQSCPTLCDPIDGSPPGSAAPGILQARTLQWVAISFSSAWKWKVKVNLLSRVRLFETPWTAAYEAPPPMRFSRQEYWSGVYVAGCFNECTCCVLFMDLNENFLEKYTQAENCWAKDNVFIWLDCAELEYSPEWPHTLRAHLRCLGFLCLYSPANTWLSDLRCSNVFRLPWWLSGEESTCQCMRPRRCVWSLGRWRRKWQPTPGFLPENGMFRGAWRATVHGATEETWLNNNNRGLFDILNACFNFHFSYAHSFFTSFCKLPIYKSFLLELSFSFSF